MGVDIDKILVFTLAILFCLAIFGVFARAEGTTIISVEPQNTSVGSPKKNFSIDINVTDALATYAFEFKLRWSPSILNITDLTYGTFLSQGGDINCAQDIHYSEGWLMFGCTLLEPATSQSGNGNLAKLNFTVLTEGNSNLQLNETYLLDDNLNNYTHTTRDGYFTVCMGDINRDGEVDNIDLGHLASAYGSTPNSANWNPEADLNSNGLIDIFDMFPLSRNYGKVCTVISQEAAPVTALSIEPEKISVPNATNTTFDVNLSMDYVENLYAYKFKLKYDPDVLSATKLTYSYLNNPVSVWKNIIDNNKGEIQFEITSWFGAKPKTGKGNLATMTFQVKDFGNSNIDIFDSKLADAKKLISHDVKDGLFINYLLANVDIKPDTLSLKNNGNWITAYIVLPLNYNVSNVNMSSVDLWYQNNYVPASYGVIQNNTLIVKFDRTSSQELLSPCNVELTVTGEVFYNNRYIDFKGTDKIRVIS